MGDNAWKYKLCGFISMTCCVIVYNHNTKDPLHSISFVLMDKKKVTAAAQKLSSFYTDTDQWMNPQRHNKKKTFSLCCP